MGSPVVEFAPDHPCGAGHFPGNPLIPGALLLAAVLAEIAADLGVADVWQVKSAKFLLPVRPGDSVEVAYSPAAAGEIRFNGSVAGQQVISGIVYALPGEAPR